MAQLERWVANTKRVQARDKLTTTIYEFESVFPDGAPDGTAFSATEMNKIIDAINGINGGDPGTGAIKRAEWVEETLVNGCTGRVRTMLLGDNLLLVQGRLEQMPKPQDSVLCTCSNGRSNLRVVGDLPGAESLILPGYDYFMRQYQPSMYVGYDQSWGQIMLTVWNVPYDMCGVLAIVPVRTEG